LQVFEASARLSSITRTAEELFLPQPTVSMQIKKLEGSVGLPLIEQVGKRISLTDAGHALYRTAREILETIGRFEMEVAEPKGLKTGQLRLAVITTAKYFMPRLLERFCQEYPGIDASLEVTNRERLIERMSRNLDDLYVIGRPPESPEYEFEPYLANPLVIVAPSNHPLVGVSGIPLRRLPENGIPDCAGFSFVIKARHQAHSQTMSVLSQHRGRTKRQAGWYVI
jgi:DNA-binding transcriptional LysR family regulator